MEIDFVHLVIHQPKRPGAITHAWMMAQKIVDYLAGPPSSACELPQAAESLQRRGLLKQAAVPAKGVRSLVTARHNTIIRHQSTSMRVRHE
jgi:hypothetical protein